MRKLLLALFSMQLLFATFLDGIAVIVNNEPITTYEITKTASKLHISKKEALQLLIRKKLEESEIKRLGIEINDFEVENTIDTFAKQKGMDIIDLQMKLEQQGIDWQEYKRGVKEQLLRKKLYEAIMQQSMRNIDESTLRDYYEKHKERFSVAKAADVIKYISPSKEILQKIVQNPLYRPTDPLMLQQGQEHIDLAKVSPQLSLLIQQTPEGGFTPILPLGEKYLLIYVKKKEGREPIAFEKVKGYILKQLASKKREKSIDEYFAKLKAKAKITILRLP